MKISVVFFFCKGKYVIGQKEEYPDNNIGAQSEEENQLKCIKNVKRYDIERGIKSLKYKMLKDMIPSEDLKHLKYHKLSENAIN